eukprot:COSAG01_NODE_662_length_14431_cov_31.385775_6_plen_126_part_00
MSILLAKFLGILMTILGLGICMNHHHIKDMFSVMLHHKSFSISSILMPLVLGSLIVTLHNIWIDGWTLLITLVGYLFLFIGMMRAIMPDFWMSFFKKLKIHIPSPVFGLLVLIVGLVFMYHGFLV